MTQGRRTLPPPDPGADFTTLQPDPSRVGGIPESPLVRLPDTSGVFAARAARLRTLAEGNPLGEYMQLLARIADAQHSACAALPIPPLPPQEQLAHSAEHAMPPLTMDQVRGSAEFQAVLSWLLDHAVLDGAPLQTASARDALLEMSTEERLSLAADVFEGAFPIDRVAECLFVAAALQVHLAGLAAQLAPLEFKPVADGVCPVCGGAPVSSLVVGWTQASKARYCACSLCGSLWNYVRIKCTSCSSTQGIAYYTIEDGPKSVGVETCTACRSYIKHMQQHENPALDPVADDIGTYGLDVLARDQDFRRAGLNPFFIIG